METQLIFDNKTRNLLLGFKEKFRTDEEWVLKVNGSLNTATGKASCAGSLFKQVFHGKRAAPSLRKAAEQKDLRTRLGAGLLLDMDAGDVRTGVNAAHYVTLGSPHTYVKLFAQAEYNTQSNKSHAVGRVQVSKAIYNFTSDQDVKLTAGYKARLNDKGDIDGEFFGEARENNWRVQTDFKGKWIAMYDL